MMLLEKYHWKKKKDENCCSRGHGHMTHSVFYFEGLAAAPPPLVKRPHVLPLVPPVSTRSSVCYVRATNTRESIKWGVTLCQNRIFPPMLCWVNGGMNEWMSHLWVHIACILCILHCRHKKHQDEADPFSQRNRRLVIIFAARRCIGESDRTSLWCMHFGHRSRAAVKLFTCRASSTKPFGNGASARPWCRSASIEKQVGNISSASKKNPSKRSHKVPPSSRRRND